jgi:hypothetical protein
MKLSWHKETSAQCLGMNCHVHVVPAGKAMREAVTATVAQAFDTIFPDANPRLIPVLNHQKVPLLLLLPFVCLPKRVRLSLFHLPHLALMLPVDFIVSLRL